MSKHPSGHWYRALPIFAQPSSPMIIFPLCFVCHDESIPDLLSAIIIDNFAQDIMSTLSTLNGTCQNSKVWSDKITFPWGRVPERERLCGCHLMFWQQYAGTPVHFKFKAIQDFSRLFQKEFQDCFNDMYF